MKRQTHFSNEKLMINFWLSCHNLNSFFGVNSFHTLARPMQCKRPKFKTAKSNSNWSWISMSGQVQHWIMNKCICRTVIELSKHFFKMLSAHAVWGLPVLQGDHGLHPKTNTSDRTNVNIYNSSRLSPFYFPIFSKNIFFKYISFSRSCCPLCLIANLQHIYNWS